MQWTLVTPSRAAARTSARLSSKKSIEPSGTPCHCPTAHRQLVRRLPDAGLRAARPRAGKRESKQVVRGRPRGEGVGGGPRGEGRRHRAPLDLLEVQRLGSVLDDDGVGANHFGGGAAARLDSQHLEPLPRPCRSVGTRGYGDRHIGIGESEQRTSAGRVKVEQLTARALDATETIIHWSEGRAATQPWPVPLQKHREAERLHGVPGCELSRAPA